MHEECYTYVYTCISNSGICSMLYIYVNTYILHLLGLVKALQVMNVVFLQAVVSELSCVLSSDDRGRAADRSVVMPCHFMACLINKWNGILSDILANQRASIAREHQNPFFPVNSYFFFIKIQQCMISFHDFPYPTLTLQALSEISIVWILFISKSR